MNHPDRPGRHGSNLGQSQRLLGETIDHAHQAIEELRAGITHSQALGQAVADLARELNQISKEENTSVGAQEDKPWF